MKEYTKEQIENFLDNENLAFGKNESVSKAEADRNGGEYYLVDLLMKFQNELQASHDNNCGLGGVSDSASIDEDEYYKKNNINSVSGVGIRKP